MAMVLESFGLSNKKWELLDAHERECNTRTLTFAGFRRRFSTFPVVLDARHVGRLSDRVELADLFRRPDRLFLTDLYAEALARHGDEAGGRPVGLVVPFGGYRGGVVIHNGAVDTGGVRLQYPIPGDAPPHRLTAEPFHQLLAYLAAGGWCPDGPGGDDLPTARPDPAGVTAVVSPWMAQRLGTGPAFALYVWLAGLMGSASARHRDFIRRGKNGVRYLAATREELTVASGLPPDAVKRGLAQLRELGLILTRRGDGRTFVVLVPPDEADGEGGG
ncbi:hypothetical protein ETAA1_29480 [Urbifossiella limnaea]|uniref:Uncharacterized protein n=1 Tax=Urbifossiella limnaea TaxID=2528023 RepID=A0A517XU02_9BACT|nr:hypothetical protein ETAA1_29480 [Urbifossiella limnaea]